MKIIKNKSDFGNRDIWSESGFRRNLSSLLFSLELTAIEIEIFFDLSSSTPIPPPLSPP